MDYEQLIHSIYEEWLMDNYAEIIHCSDDLIKLVEDATYVDDFIDWVLENV